MLCDITMVIQQCKTQGIMDVFQTVGLLYLQAGCSAHCSMLSTRDPSGGGREGNIGKGASRVIWPTMSLPRTAVL